MNDRSIIAERVINTVSRGNGRHTNLLKRVLFCLLVGAGGHQIARGQPDMIYEDYLIFGRKSPITLGSSFSALARYNPFENPADLAFVSENKIVFDVSSSSRGSGAHISFSAPNFGLSSATQSVLNANGILHTKKLLRYSYGIALGDVTSPISRAISLGISLDRSLDMLGSELIIDSAQVLTAVLGGVFKFGPSRLGITVMHIPLHGDFGSSRTRFVLAYQTVTSFGLRLGIQGLPGTGYGKEDPAAFGLRFGLAQSFLNGRLDSRLQLGSFYDSNLEAKMQNLTAGVGYRLNPNRRGGAMAFLLDTEFSYTLSFLYIPKIIGTHMLAIAKYF